MAINQEAAVKHNEQEVHHNSDRSLYLDGENIACKLDEFLYELCGEHRSHSKWND